MNTRALLLCLLLTPGCSHDHDGHDHGHDHDHGAAAHGEEGHAHTAPHGGVLVPVGGGGANVEVVHDAEAGSLDLFLLDGCAENPVRCAQESLVVQLGDARFELPARASELTGETVGDTSQFSLTDEGLKGATLAGAQLSVLEILGQRLEAVALAGEGE